MSQWRETGLQSESCQACCQRRGGVWQSMHPTCATFLLHSLTAQHPPGLPSSCKEICIMQSPCRCIRVGGGVGGIGKREEQGFVKGKVCVLEKVCRYQLKKQPHQFNQRKMNAYGGRKRGWWCTEKWAKCVPLMMCNVAGKYFVLQGMTSST